MGFTFKGNLLKQKKTKVYHSLIIMTMFKFLIMQVTRVVFSLMVAKNQKLS